MPVTSHPVTRTTSRLTLRVIEADGSLRGFAVLSLDLTEEFGVGDTLQLSFGSFRVDAVRVNELGDPVVIGCQIDERFSMTTMYEAPEFTGSVTHLSPR